MEFTFWKENKLDQEYVLTIEEIKEKYRKFCETRESSWLVYYGHSTVNFFIGDKEGLNSVADNETYADLQEELAKIRHEFYKEEA